MKKGKVMLLTLLVMVMSIMAASVAGAAPVADFEPNIMDIAAADDRFDTLEAAVKAANLADALAAPGNLTVFAPTDDAFAALPAELIDALLADPSGALTQILLYHVVPGSLSSADVLASSSLETLQGSDLTVSLRNGKPYVNDSQIIITDIQAKNGIIHVIDAVLVPPVSLPDTAMAEMSDKSSLPTIAEIAIADGRFNTLVAALSAAGLADTFLQPGSYTVFAPTDDAFAALPAGTVEALLADPQGMLTTILLYHVVGDELTRNQLATDDYVPTLEGRALTVNRDGSTIVDISGAKLLITDIQASNGVIHVIDSVLLP
ncbi:MAG: fasciclin domain-containing protein [Ardenticatenaceae bacterium]|nr:fasciclin domain-containing protein [Ardenticatenaceae bacterium]MCB9445546.1 fasciclin domain-containing protein [Ardenticatenaceae bacterium]